MGTGSGASCALYVRSAMSVLGIDLAAGAKKTYACTLADGALHAEIFAHCDDERLLELAKGRKKIAIDAPFGWPREFVNALNAHRQFQAWPAPDDGVPETFRAALSFRATDRVVMHTRRPLSVSTDKLGVTAMRCAYLLHRWASSGESVDRTGAGKFVEVYPAGALVRWGLKGSGYKGADREALSTLLANVFAALPQLEMSEEDRQLCATLDDAFDALLAALVARAATLGLTDPPTQDRREQAAEEGWIHLPLRGSLALLARSRSELQVRPAEALAERLRSQGVTVDTKGYADSFDGAVLPGFAEEVKAAIKADLLGKGGSELLGRGEGAPKFHASHSSACLAANTFGPWLIAQQDMPFDAETFTGETHLEVECPTGLQGTPPTLDCIVDGPWVLAVESKCTETFSTHEANFAPAYRELVATVAHKTWSAEYERLVEDPRRYRYLDAAQLIKHYLGLRQSFKDRPITLAYLFWEPTNAPDVAACVIHASELAEFARRLSDPLVRFVGMPYPDLWAEWSQDTNLSWLGDHVATLKQRYETAL